MRKSLAAFALLGLLTGLSIVSVPPPQPAQAAIGTPASLGSAVGSPGTVTSLPITTTADILTGDAVFMIGTGSVNNVYPTAAVDSGGVNSYTCVNLNTNAPTGVICYTLNATALATGGTITATYQSTSATKVVCAFRVSGMATAAPAYVTANKNGANAQTGTATSAGSPVTMVPLAAQPALLIGVLSSGADTGAVTMAGWTAACSGSGASPRLKVYYKVASAYASDATWQPAWVNNVLYRTMARSYPGGSVTYAPFGQATLLGIGQ